MKLNVITECFFLIFIKYKNKQGKYLLRQVLYKYIPKEMVDKPKSGFTIPLDDWLRGPLKIWAEELLFSAELHKHDIFELDNLRAIWQEHLGGKRQLGSTLWNILMFQAWYKVNFSE